MIATANTITAKHLVDYPAGCIRINNYPKARFEAPYCFGYFHYPVDDFGNTVDIVSNYFEDITFWSYDYFIDFNYQDYLP